MGIPTSKSCKPLIVEDDYSPTADYYLNLLQWIITLEPNWFNHQIHQKQIIGTPTNKSGKSLIAEDDYELTAVSRPKYTDSYL